MPGLIGLGLVTGWAVGLIVATEPAAPPDPLAVWDQCRDEALVAHPQQTLGPRIWTRSARMAANG